MLRMLRVKPVPADRVDYARHDLLCVVDAQPSTGYVSLPEGVRADVIFDHYVLLRKGKRTYAVLKAES